MKKIPVMVEKPISETSLQAEEMFKNSKKYKTSLMVGHIERFNPAIIRLKQIIDKGEIGKIITLSAFRVGITPPKTMNSDVTCDLGIHDIDVFNYLLNEFPSKATILKQKIFTHTKADIGTIVLNYISCTGLIQTNWITPIKMRKLYITGTEAFAELDYISQKLLIYKKIINTKTEGDFYEFISVLEPVKKEIFVSKKEPLKEELKYFLQHRNDSGPINVESAISALKILEI